MATGQAALRDAIVAGAVATSQRRSTNWRDRLPDDVRELIEEIKKDWKDGAFLSSGQALARSIKQVLASKGHETVGAGEIYRWLAGN